MDVPRQSPVDGRLLAIGVLSVTACVLFVGFMLVAQRPAQAIGQSDRAGDYKMLTLQTRTDREMVVVIDGAARRAILYDFDFANKALEIAATIPLDQLPKPRPEEEQAPPTGGRRRP